MEETLVDRLNLYLEQENISRSEFADTCGILRSSLSQILSGRNKKIGDDVIRAIHRAYPKISIKWLLFGETEAAIEPDESMSKLTGSTPCDEVTSILPKSISKIVVFYTDKSFDEFYIK